MTGLWVGRRFHASYRWWDKVSGPLGLGVRFFFWQPKPKDWSCNVDILLPVIDVQFGFHCKTREAV